MFRIDSFGLVWHIIRSFCVGEIVLVLKVRLGRD